MKADGRLVGRRPAGPRFGTCLQRAREEELRARGLACQGALRPPQVQIEDHLAVLDAHAHAGALHDHLVLCAQRAAGFVHNVGGSVTGPPSTAQGHSRTTPGAIPGAPAIPPPVVAGIPAMGRPAGCVGALRGHRKLNCKVFRCARSGDISKLPCPWTGKGCGGGGAVGGRGRFAGSAIDPAGTGRAGKCNSPPKRVRPASEPPPHRAQ